METKRYYSKVAGSKFIMPDGKELFFNHGFHDLKEEDYVGVVCSIAQMNGNPPDRRNGVSCFEVYKAELDTLIKAGNPLLYIQGTQPEQLPNVGADANALSEAKAVQGEVAMRAAGAVASGDVNHTPGQLTPSDVNASTVDTNLKGMVLKDKPDIRAQAAARTVAQAAAVGAKTGQAQ